MGPIAVAIVVERRQKNHLSHEILIARYLIFQEGMKKDFCVVKLVGKGGDSLLESGENAAGESDSDGKYLDEDHLVWCTEVGIILHFELTIILHILHILNILHILHIWMRTMWCGAQKLVFLCKTS